MKKLTKAAALAGVLSVGAAAGSANAWWGPGGPGYGSGFGDTFSDVFGDMFGDFNMNMSGRTHGYGRGYGRGYGYGYGHPYLRLLWRSLCLRPLRRCSLRYRASRRSRGSGRPYRLQ